MSTVLKFVLAAALVIPALAIAPRFTHSVVDAACGVGIYRIYYDSPGTDTGANKSLNAEWIQLRNSCAKGKSLSGWTIKDAAGARYRFGTYTLSAGGKVKVHTGKGSNTSTDRYWGKSWYVWNNTGKETAKLRNSAGTVIDSCSYTGSSAANVYC